MVSEGINRRRRMLLGTVASGVGFLAAGQRASPVRPADASHPGPPMTGAGDESIVPTFMVFQEDAETHVRRRGVDEPVFSGAPSTAIQHAIDAGEAMDTGTAIAVGPGTFELGQPVTLAASTWLAGSGTSTTLQAAGGLNEDILTVPAGAEHVRISDIRIDGNRGENARGNCLVIAGDTWRTVVEHLVVRAGAGDGVRFERGPEGEYSYEPMLVDVDVARCAGDGYVFGYTGDLFGVNVYAESCEGYGFTMADAGGTLVHPHAYDTRGEAGIRILESTKDAAILGAHSERNMQHGMLIKGERITVRNAFVANNSRAAVGSYSGVVLDGARNCIVSESTLINDPERERAQGHGLTETPNSRDNSIFANRFQENVLSAIDRQSRSTGTTYRYNHGYSTENGGIETLSDGETIHHGLDETPQQCWVEAMGPGVYAHVVDIGSSHIGVEILQVGTGKSVESKTEVSWSAVVL